MPKTYTHIDETDPLYHRILDVMEKHHHPLKEAALNLTVIVAHGPRDQNGDQCGPALTHGGYEAMATIKIVSLKDRSLPGMGDAILTLDGDRYDELSEQTFEALIDHELFHLILVVDKDGAIVRDDLGRPKLRMRKHDIQIGGFSQIIQKHKQHALEATQVNEAFQTWVQPAFNWG